nr:hypothetical protein BgiMline_034933 [Biomphalaria glabrata]
MIGRADIEGSKSNVAMNAWLPQASYPCGNFSDTSCFKLLKVKRIERPPTLSRSVFVLKIKISELLPILLYARLFTSETAADMGTALARNSHRLRGVFKGRQERTGHRKSRGAFGAIVPISGQADSRDEAPYKKRELFPGLPPTSPTSFALPHVAPKDQSPCPGSGILTRFPFDKSRATN